MNNPNELTPQEWAEVAGVGSVFEAFGLEDEIDPATWMATNAYGVRFDFQSDGPGYMGPLYLIQGAGAPDDRPTTLIRGAAGLLEMVETC